MNIKEQMSSQQTNKIALIYAEMKSVAERKGVSKQFLEKRWPLNKNTTQPHLHCFGSCAAPSIIQNFGWEDLYGYRWDDHSGLYFICKLSSTFLEKCTQGPLKKINLSYLIKEGISQHPQHCITIWKCRAGNVIRNSTFHFDCTGNVLLAVTSV